MISWPRSEATNPLESTMRILALIPARGGSKSVPKKNIRQVGGKPLLAYSIGHGLEAKRIDRVIVSTDSEEIAEIARFYGAEAPFIRPPELAQDYSLDIDFYRHALEWLREHEGYVPDAVINLRPTTPVRNPAVLDDLFRQPGGCFLPYEYPGAHRSTCPGPGCIRAKSRRRSCHDRGRQHGRALCQRCRR